MPEREAVQEVIQAIAYAARTTQLGSGRAWEVNPMSEERPPNPRDERIYNVLGAALAILAGAWIVAYIVAAIRAWLF